MRKPKLELVLKRLRTRGVRVWAFLICAGLAHGTFDVLLHADSVCHACTERPASHNAGEHGFRPSAPVDAPPPHCLACHFSRVLRLGDTQPGRLVPASDATVVRYFEPAAVFVSDPSRSQLPSRAPPSVG